MSQAITNGADGYVLKNIKPFELREAIKSTIRGFNVIKDDVYNSLMKHLDSKPGSGHLNSEGVKVDFSEKEIQIIQWVVQGLSNKEIAHKMNLSEARIKSILSDIFIKLKIEDRIQLAVYAVKNHLCE